MTYVYDKSGQRIFVQREGSTYGKPYDPEAELTAFTAVPADYPHWRRLDIIEDTFDVPVAFIEKLKKYDLEDAKHPSAILSGNIAPVEIAFDMPAQGLEFLPMAIGNPAVTSHKQAMVQTITCPANDGTISDNDYFLLDLIDGSGDVEHHLFWFDETTGGSAPTVTGINATNRHECAIDGDSLASEVATTVATAINGVTGFGASASGAVVTVTNDNNGAVQMGHNGAASPSCIFGVNTWGSTDYGTVELVNTTLPSFTFHVEQQNETSGEDLVYDLFGCVVQSITLNLTYGDQIATYNVVFKCPYAIENSNGRNTNNPPRKYIQSFPAMSSLQESAQNRLLMENPDTTTDIDRTPKTVDSIVLTITNNVEFKGDISKRYLTLPVAGKREITLQIIGNTHEKELFQYFLEAFTDDGTDWYPSSANGRLKTVYKIQRDATYDYILISFYNWTCDAHNFSFVSVDDAVKAVDMTFSDGSSDSNGRIIDDFDFVSYIDKTIMVV
jgi:hypothetical protein